MYEQDPRLAELHALAESQGLQLPMAVEKILRLEDRGFVVDLRTGRVQMPTVGLPTRHAQAIAHLLANADGPVSL